MNRSVILNNHEGTAAFDHQHGRHHSLASIDTDLNGQMLFDPCQSPTDTSRARNTDFNYDDPKRRFLLNLDSWPMTRRSAIWCKFRPVLILWPHFMALHHECLLARPPGIHIPRLMLRGLKKYAWEEAVFNSQMELECVTRMGSNHKKVLVPLYVEHTGSDCWRCLSGMAMTLWPASMFPASATASHNLFSRPLAI